EHAVVQSSYPRGSLQLSFSIETRRRVNDVIHLPLARRKTGVGQWWVLSIDGARRAIRVGLVPKRIEHLHFITIQAKEDAAIASALSFAFSRLRCRPFDVQLAIAEVLQRPHIATALDAFHVTVARDPFR